MQKLVKRVICGIIFTASFTTGVVAGNMVMADGLQSWEKGAKDFVSSWAGIERKIKVFTKTGEVVYEFEGRFDIDTDRVGRIVFDANDSRVITNMDYIAVEKN